MAANPTPQPRVIRRGCAVFGHVWQCDDCRAAHPDLAPESWQFVNKSGECPRCVARTAAAEDDQ